ncbi:response regulator receiver domain-containing protein [Algoriphagus boseongensis]|uniref:Response regulator receiver domain-containing protein n=1 Tax=Algoriphagus boseongensis TaxID=1442587 RepID=A0A4R6T4M3_9BACT|nr:response regulator [Algoriphagus boseongensis]TDQ16919.1 response regulator receiver domain-containing protein [Algoriphagus boseongensis]
MKILFVDDERDIEDLFRQKFRKEIRNEGLELVFAFSGQEALDVLGSENPPKVMYVFSDINMPGMSGLEMLAKAKERFPQITISMISAYGDSENYNKAMESGASGFFTKPVDFEALRKEIHQILSQ